MVASLSGLASATEGNPLEGAYIGWLLRNINVGLGNESTEVLGRVLANVQNVVGRGWNESEIACRGIEDLSRILERNSERLSSLDSESERYEFWNTQGVYENYTPRERAFLNNAVLPGVLPGLVSGGREAIATASGVLSGVLRSVAPDTAHALAMFQVQMRFPGLFGGGRSGGAGAGRTWGEEEDNTTENRLRGLILVEIALAREQGRRFAPPILPDPIPEPKKPPTPIPQTDDPEGNGRGSRSHGDGGKGSYSTHIRLTK